MTNNNADQIEYWNGDAGLTWAKRQQRMDALLAPISDAALQACAAARGERVLDVGCGCGETTLRLAARGAHATGVDVSQPMLARARERAAAEHVSATFVHGDAAEVRFERPFDHVFSRFGVMFFADPRAAFTNIRKALRGGAGAAGGAARAGAAGSLCFVCWQLPQYNPWIATPFAAARALLPPQPPFDPRAPGPFAFADADYVREILTGADFTSIRIDPLAATLTLGHDVDSALQMVCEVGPLSRSLAGVDAATRERVVTAVREPLRANATAAGVAFGATCWIVRAFA